jgi:hypothetical protein
VSRLLFAKSFQPIPYSVSADGGPFSFAKASRRTLRLKALAKVATNQLQPVVMLPPADRLILPRLVDVRRPHQDADARSPTRE